jgi:APA family basic amino acid/polyamine antiporter
MTPQKPIGHLEKGLGLREAIALVVGTIIGTGIFLKAAIMTQLAGSIGAVLIAWLVAAVLSLLGALCYAELGSRMPESGGEYVFLKKGWHPIIGFLYGWTRFWIGSPSAIAAYAAGSAAFASGFMNVNAIGGRNVFAILLIWIFTLLNCFKVSLAGGVQVSLTVLKLALIVSIAAAVFIFSPVGDWSHFTAGPSMTWESLLSPTFGAAVLAALWAFDGWNNMPMAAAEIKDGQKNVPRALISGISIVTVMYLIANLGWYFGVHYDDIITSNSTKFKEALPVASKAVLPFMGERGVALISVAFVLSAIGAMNGSILTSARVPWAMARDGLFPQWMATLNPKTHVPARTLVIQGFCATALAATGSFDQLTDYVVFSSWIWYALAAASLFRLRRMDGHFRGYKIKWFPIVPLLFIGSSIWLLIQAIYSNPTACAIGAGIIVAGIPVFLRLGKTSTSS